MCPCKSVAVGSGFCDPGSAVAEGRPVSPGVIEPVLELVPPFVVPVNPNSRLGRSRSPLAQGRVAMEPIVVGIDVSKDRLDVAILPSGEAFAVPRDSDGLDALVERLRPLAPQAVALEATGGYEAVVVATLGAAGLPMIVVNPAQIRAFGRALGQRAKTDPIDALLIARFTAMTKPEVRPLPDEATQRLADLVARRRQIITMMVAERQRQKRMTERRLLRSIARLLEALQRELSEIDREIGDDVRGSPAWREKEELLSSVPGVGPVISRTLIAEMPELGQLDRREIAALAGLAPWTRQSGQWKGRSFIGGGRAAVRTALYMGAVTASRHNPALKQFRDRLIAAGKQPMVALIAVARKLLTILNAVLRDKKPWREQNA
jgi:transposase